MESRRLPGEVRDAVVEVLGTRPRGASVAEIVTGVHDMIGKVPRSSVRSYLRLNTPRLFVRQGRGHYSLSEASARASGGTPRRFGRSGSRRDRADELAHASLGTGGAVPGRLP